MTIEEWRLMIIEVGLVLAEVGSRMDYFANQQSSLSNRHSKIHQQPTYFFFLFLFFGLPSRVSGPGIC